MSREFRTLMLKSAPALEHKIMLSPVPMVAALRVGRNGSMSGPRKRKPSAPKKPADPRKGVAGRMRKAGAVSPTKSGLKREGAIRAQRMARQAQLAMPGRRSGAVAGSVFDVPRMPKAGRGGRKR